MTKTRLMLGDCLERMKEIETGSVDMVLTDPPYGIDFQSEWSKKGPRHKKIIGDNITDFSWLKECVRVLSINGGALVFSDWRKSEETRIAMEVAGLKIISQVIWDREHHGMGDLTGAFAPQHDVIWYATKGRRTWGKGRPKSVIRSRRPSPSGDNGHPTCKPVDLMDELARVTGSGAVLDPFMGSGTTGIACLNTGRNFIGIEKDEHYFNLASKRIAEHKIINE